ncbi:MAG: type I restriction-modification system subunit M [Planctomycetes bacterium GWF2_42_9]|nr:MAG: type I restriction-modification system subunit M [Planctomycetes bacterium GWF2_42_9]
MAKVNKEEINNIVWRACDTFRGTIDPSQYKDYILVMLFVKYMSDIWKDKKEEITNKNRNNPELIRRKLERERFRIPEVHLRNSKGDIIESFSADFDSIYERRERPNLGEIINVALEGIEDANKEKLEGVFRNIDFNSEANLGQTKERNRRLQTLLDDFNDKLLNLRPSHLENTDVIGDAYEYLIAHFASDAGKKGGEFYTPKEVATLLAKLLDPKEGDTICDPACGSGSLLIQIAKEIGSSNFSLFGQELNGSTWALCKMNMFLHGMDSARIEWCDTIRNPKLLEDSQTLLKFKKVAANPPFSLDKWGADTAEHDVFNRFYRGVPPKSKGDYAFITHMLETAVADDGKVGVIVPHGVLFRGGSEGKIRKRLIEENLIELVVGLPANLFFGTGIPAAIIIFNKGKKTKDVLFIDASKDYGDAKKQNKLRDEDIGKIVKTFKQFKAINKYSYRASYKEIAENDYNLNIPRYVDTFEPEEEINISAIQKEIETLEKQLADTHKKMAACMKELGL